MHSIKKTFTVKKDPTGESGSAKSMPLPGSGICHSDPAGAYFMTYQEQLKSPKWQKKRLKIMERDRFSCRICDDNTRELHVHHKAYIKGVNIWEYPNFYLITLCNSCHALFHKKNIVTNDDKFERISDDFDLIKENKLR